MKNKRSKLAVSEVIGTAILLGIGIALFTVVQTVALTFPFNPSTPSAQLVGTINENTIFINHQGGESLSFETKILFSIEGETQIVHRAKDILDNTTSNGDNYWNLGERVTFTPSYDISDLSVEVTVVDIDSNSIVMQGILQGGG
jgi:hypothetical protein